MQRFTKTNTQGRLVGESHPRARLTDEEVELALQLREQDRVSLAWLARKFEVSKSCMQHIVSGRNRCQAPVLRIRGPVAAR